MSFIKKVIRRALFKISAYKNPIKAARKIGVKVGDRCSFAAMPNFGSEPYLIEIGNHVRTSASVNFMTHDGATWIFREEEKYKRVLRYGRIKIGDDCFLGFNCTIMPGVTIGNNCIVGACALVAKDVPDGSVVVGVPAHVICTTEEYKEKCLREAPVWDPEAFKRDKRAELLRVIK